MCQWNCQFKPLAVFSVDDGPNTNSDAAVVGIVVAIERQADLLVSNEVNHE